MPKLTGGLTFKNFFTRNMDILYSWSAYEHEATSLCLLIGFFKYPTQAALRTSDTVHGGQHCAFMQHLCILLTVL